VTTSAGEGDRPPAVTRAVLEDIATRAGDIALRHFGRVAPERKIDRTIVTEADREVESYVATALMAAFPDAGILGEEGTVREGQGARRFVVDPIDGTSAFVAGLPTWCVCVGLLEGAVPRAGVVYLPCTREHYTAVDGRATWKGVPLSPLDDSPPAGDAFVLVHSKAHREHSFAHLGKLRSLGSAAYHTVLVARGAARAALLGNARVWDLTAAGAVLLATGGGIELLEGGPVPLETMLDGSRAPGDVVAGTAAAIAELRARLGA